ncbi:MAG: (Fe-S)-binding protein [Leptospiraceae bacterium]|nr:(Fe-S)-binding protein [Leptospiraceae bacterium]MDW7975357.1 (Fe-S)-binding protein [Leptospiraceae bacterium]
MELRDILINLFHFVVFFGSLMAFVYAIVYRVRIMNKSQPVKDLASWDARIRSFLFNVLFQQKLYKNPLRGIMHAFIFYGFIVYIFHTTSQMIAGNLWSIFQLLGIDPYLFTISRYIQIFSLNEFSALAIIVGLIILMVLTYQLYVHLDGKNNYDPNRNVSLQWKILSLLGIKFLALLLVVVASGEHVYEAIVLNFSILVLVGLLFFAYRRWILKAKGLDIPSPQSAIVIGLISVLMVSTIVGLTAKAYLENHAFSWVNTLMFPLLEFLGMDQPFEARSLLEFAWWLHLATVYAFMIYIPNSKHSHLLYAPANFFLIREKPRGAMDYIDIENSQVWGAANITEFKWTTLLDSLSCIECGRCTVECPANRTGKPLNPKKIMVDIKHAMMDYANEILSNTESANSRVIGEPYITEEELWSCTTCYACVETCPVGDNQLDAILEMRRYLVLGESNFPSQLQLAFTNMEKNANPWGIGAHTRADWAEGLGVKTLAEDPNVEVLYWVGCAASFDERNRKVARTLVEIFRSAGVSFGILGTEENCSGDSARRGGNEYLYQMLAQTNVNTLNQYNVKTIVTACPHCYNTIKNEYPQFGGNYEVYHHTQFLDKLIKEGKITLDPEKKEKLKSISITYHDSCYLGRYNSIYDEPRNLLEQSTSTSIIEAEDHRKKGLCCGAGGAQMWMEEKYERVNIKRTEQLLKTGANMIGVACPFCMIMITDGVKAKGKQEEVKVMDVSEVLLSAIKKQDKISSIHA